MPDISLPWIITSVLALIILRYLYKHWLTWRYQNKIKQMQQAKLRSNFVAAIDFRSTFSLQFHQTKLQKLKINGMLLSFDHRSLKIDTNLKHNLTPLVGEKVKVYFSVPHKEAPLFYEFPSVILSSGNDQSNSVLELKAPETLNENQKRAFLRLAPRQGIIAFLGLWVDLPKKDITPIIDSLPPPARLKKSVDNISAGGMRILFDILDPMAKTLVINQGVTLLLILKNTKEKPDQALWLTAYVVATHKAVQYPNKLYVSLKFTSWASFQPNPDQELFWMEVGTEGIAPIASFVVLRHLEQHNLNTTT